MPHELELLRELQHYLQHEIKRLEHEKVLCQINLDSVENTIIERIRKSEEKE